MIKNDKKGLFKAYFYRFLYCSVLFWDHLPYCLYLGSIKIFLISIQNNKGHLLTSTGVWDKPAVSATAGTDTARHWMQKPQGLLLSTAMCLLVEIHNSYVCNW